MPDSPYIGLNYFEESDADLFFGRDVDCRRIAGNLGASRLTVLYAESGVGKSSVLRAGVAAPLRTDGHYLPVVFSRWGPHTTRRLIQKVEDAVRLAVPDRAEPLCDDSLAEALLDAAKRTDAMPVVILDQ